MNTLFASGLESLQTRRVSFILPVMDNPGRLAEVLPGIARLMTGEDELIVADGSRGPQGAACREACRGIADLVISEPDVSAGHAANKGVLKARGRYLLVLTTDDVIHPGPFAKALEILEADPGLDILLCGGSREMDGAMSWFYVPPGADYGRHPGDVLLYGGCGVALIARYRAFARAGLWDTARYLSDAEFLMRAIHLGLTVRFCRLNVFHHPIEAAGSSMTYAAEAAAMRQMLRARYVETFPGPKPVKLPMGEPVWDGGFS